MPSLPSPQVPPFPQRDRVAILLALIGVIFLAWSYVLYLWFKMPAMDADSAGGMMSVHPWTGGDFLFMLGMWVIMMVGMMLPSAIPMTLLYAGMVRKAQRQDTPMAPTAAFVAGYVAIWFLFSVGATLVQWGLHEAAMLTPMMMAKSPIFGGVLLVLAGMYQLTIWKTVCLEHCRSPAHFFAEHWRAGAKGAFRLGLHHGAFCLGCCWALMGLLFVGGIMNLLWIAAITIFVFLEKVLPVSVAGGRRWKQLSGVGLLLSGLGLLVRGII